MSEQDKNTRPSQVTMAGWVALVGSVLLVLTLFEAVGQLQTVQFRDQIDEFLSTPPGSGLGLEIPQVVEIMRVLMLFSGAAAAAAMVLAIYVLQRNNGARIGFTVAAAVIMLTAPVAGGFLPIMIGFAAVMLWSRPARDWFAGRPVTQTGAFSVPPSRGRHRDTPPAGPGDGRAEGGTVSAEDHRHDDDRNGPEQGTPEQPDGGTPPPTWPGGSDQEHEQGTRPVPPPTQGYGAPGGRSYPQGDPQQGTPQGGHPPEPYGQGYPPPGGPGPQYGRPRPPYGYPGPGQQVYPYGYPPPPGQQYGQPYGPQYGQQYGQQYGAPRHSDGDRRPTTVTVAAWITWVLSSLAVLFFVMIALVMVAARDEFLRQLQRDPNFQAFDLPVEQVVAVVWVIGAIALLWGVAALVLAWFAYRRANWARITLVVSSAVTLLVSLAAFPVGLLHTLGAGAVIALLFLGGANQWYGRRSSGDQGFPGASPPYGGQPGQYGQPGQSPSTYTRPADPGETGPDRSRDDKDEPPPNVW